MKENAYLKKRLAEALADNDELQRQLSNATLLLKMEIARRQKQNSHARTTHDYAAR